MNVIVKTNKVMFEVYHEDHESHVDYDFHESHVVHVDHESHAVHVVHVDHESHVDRHMDKHLNF